MVSRGTALLFTLLLHTLFQVPVQSGSKIATTSQVRATVTLLLLVLENQQSCSCRCLKWYAVQTKFRENRSCGSKNKMGHTQTRHGYPNPYSLF
jgi:hypothetical protein